MKKYFTNKKQRTFNLSRYFRSGSAALLIGCCIPDAGAQQVTTINATGTGTFNVPASADSIIVECWGGGGSGGGTGNTGHGGGGGGGAYASKTFSTYYGNALTAGPISYNIAPVPSTSSGTGGSGGPATFGNTGNILLSANGGGGGSVTGGGAGGSATIGNGITSFAGGNGASGGTGDGGAGGGSAGAGGAGGNASGMTPGAAGAGINGQSAGAAGAAGLNATSNGTAGSQPGAGASGGRRKSGGTVQGGVGGKGLIRITVYGVPLAIKLDGFSVTGMGDKNYLEWNTKSETKGDRFEVQRSSDGLKFRQLAAMDSYGAKDGKNYSFTDIAPAAGINFYRLLIINEDGSRFYSRIVSANSRERSNDLTIQVYPNPIKDELTVNIAGAMVNQEDSQLLLTDANGRMIRSAPLDLSHTAIFQMHGLPAGVYFVTFRKGKIMRSVKVIK